MNETNWSQEPSELPAKKSMPKWVWFCGGGCLLALIVGIVSLIVIGNYVKDAMDPVKTEAALQVQVPHDPLPESMQIMFHNSIGIEQFTLMDSRGFQLQFQVHEGADARRESQKMFGSDNPEIPKDLGVMKFEELRRGEVEVQGRTLPVLRVKLEFSGLMAKFMPKEAKDQVGNMLWVDLAPEGAEKLVLLQIARIHGSGEITDEEVRELLEPFHIGPNR
jgi:hypothetical protein